MSTIFGPSVDRTQGYYNVISRSNVGDSRTYNVGQTSSTLAQHCTNAIQMFCVCWNYGQVGGGCENDELCAERMLGHHLRGWPSIIPTHMSDASVDIYLNQYNLAI